MNGRMAYKNIGGAVYALPPFCDLVFSDFVAPVPEEKWNPRESVELVASEFVGSVVDADPAAQLGIVVVSADVNKRLVPEPVIDLLLIIL
jgi:hypothetical protein